MAFNVVHEHEQLTNFIVALVAVPITIIVVTLRVLASVRQRKGVGLENWFAVLALLAFLVYASIDLWIICMLNGRPVRQLDVFANDLNTIIAIYKAAYIVNVAAPLNQTFAKLCLLVLYHRLFQINRWFVRWVYAVGGAQITWCIAVICFRLFLCSPVRESWNPFTKGKCLDSQIVLAWGDSINSLLDFIMVGMAIWVVVGLRVKRAAKMRISFLFALGGFAGVIGIIKIGEAWGTIGTHIRNSTWNMAQQATSIVCCCVPIYNNLLSALKGKGREVERHLEEPWSPPMSRNRAHRESEEFEENWLPMDGSSQRALMWDGHTKGFMQKDGSRIAVRHSLKTMRGQ
ncbi:hypothetical protein QBC38DRAFT_485052 [Podospora fimiseda]|uniref:Rhodopsin domain-containing protein n=1 Tax=Podospora fimiseda TaxID=252190 RepID=A0AAN7BJL8_9PEZI|nr:hypothetical protein QBC38DRAFT_485052 [Podospora fimiseda]